MTRSSGGASIACAALVTIIRLALWFDDHSLGNGFFELVTLTYGVIGVATVVARDLFIVTGRCVGLLSSGHRLLSVALLILL